MENDQASTLAVPKHQANVLSTMSKDTKFADVALFGGQRQSSEADLQPVRAHKVLLAASSEFFSALFADNDFADSNKSEYQLERVTHEILKLILEFLYEGKVTDERIGSDVEFACDILAASTYLLIDDLALACENILIKHHLTVKNCIFLWNIACKYPNLPKLSTEIEQFLAKSLPSLMLEESFLCMEPDKVCQMMRIELIEVAASPDDRFRAALAWLEHDAGARRIFASHIFSTIPLPAGKISRLALTKACFSSALTEDATKKLLELLANSLAVAEFLADPDFTAPASSAIGSNCFSSSQTDVSSLFCISGHESGNETCFVKYHVSSKTWRRLKSLPWQQAFGAACVVRGRLMLFGGYRKRQASLSVSEYEILSEDARWLTYQACQLPYGSAFWSACCVRDTVHVCAQSTDFFEYGPFTNDFKKKSCMAVDRFGKSITYSPTFDAIYVAGGRNDETCSYDPTREIEKFDIKNNAWQTVGKATSDRVNLSSAICGDDLYLIAGDDDDKSVEKFNIRTGKAYAVPDLLSGRMCCRAAVLYNNVICVFGDNHKSVETYDVREGKWTVGDVVPDMPVAVSSCCLAWK